MIFRKGPDVSACFGKRYTDYEGAIWELVAQNDLNEPYFKRVLPDGSLSKKTYTLADGRNIAIRLADILPQCP